VCCILTRNPTPISTSDYSDIADFCSPGIFNACGEKKKQQLRNLPFAGVRNRAFLHTRLRTSPTPPKKRSKQTMLIAHASGERWNAGAQPPPYAILSACVFLQSVSSFLRFSPSARSPLRIARDRAQEDNLLFFVRRRFCDAALPSSDGRRF